MSEVWLEKFAYKEAGLLLLLMAFIQRIIIGVGVIHLDTDWVKKRIVLRLE